LTDWRYLLFGFPVVGPQITTATYTQLPIWFYCYTIIRRLAAREREVQVESKKEQEVQEELIAYFPFTTYWESDTTQTAQKTLRPTVLLLLCVYAFPWECVY
jgi:hypothetical protein